MCEKIDGKAKIQAVRKKEKSSLDIVFLLCVQSEQHGTEVDANSLNLPFLLQKWVLFLTIQPLKKSVKSLHCKRLNTSHRRGDISTPKLNRFNCTCIVLLLQVKAVPTFTLVLTREQCPAWLLFKYKTIKTTIDDFTHNIIHYIRNTSKLISIKVSR